MSSLAKQIQKAFRIYEMQGRAVNSSEIDEFDEWMYENTPEIQKRLHRSN